jgi:hypothetical protein
MIRKMDKPDSHVRGNPHPGPYPGLALSWRQPRTSQSTLAMGEVRRRGDGMVGCGWRHTCDKTCLLASESVSPKSELGRDWGRKKSIVLWMRETRGMDAPFKYQGEHGSAEEKDMMNGQAHQ